MSPIVPGSSDTSNDQLVSHEDLARQLAEARATKDLHKERQQELIAELEQLRNDVRKKLSDWEHRLPARFAREMRTLVEGDAIV